MRNQPESVLGRDPFDQNFRKFRYKIKWNRTFLEIRFENCGQPPEVVLKFRKIGMHGKSRSIWRFLLGPSFSVALIDEVNMAATPATQQQICPLVVMFRHWHSPLGHRMNRPDRWTVACDTRFRTRSTLLSVISKTIEPGCHCSSGLLVSHIYSTGRRIRLDRSSPRSVPEWYSSCVGMTSWVNSSQISLVIRKWLLNSSGKHSGIVLSK